ncbi:hypothetical protein MNEG_5830 [Monoraphidium neglectum]|uniref:Uncharacterized protein n=1 Tax=Monoraphidium neglectum TaxID=145388 RepID=A0A0D2MNQ1_9CHLO|nr:hypothetical protein MNEG_5830 [Monoraphidium neglectum]KIZ02132.1 hypothetical protein MNEG_5830 [Monoraphidium neglectum]|eukprot:XP_013901151.1 hypothetical protein MNEG_5830 [Monoraphidium neglectum]
MAAFSGTVGDPFARTPEWDYFREAPAQQQQEQQQQQQREQEGAGAGAASPAPATGDELEREIDLGAGGAQQLLQGLVSALSGAGLAPLEGGAGGHAAAAGRALVRVERLPGGAGGLRVSVAGAETGAEGSAGAADEQEVLLSGEQAESLVAALDDVVGQLPGSFLLRQPPASFSPPSRLRAAAGRAARAAAGAAQAALVAALLALPVVAVVRPGRGVMRRDEAATVQLGRAQDSRQAGVAAAAAGGSSSSVPEAAAVAGQRLPWPASLLGPGQGQQQQQQRAPPRPANGRLAPHEMAEVCEAVAGKVRGRVWLQLGGEDVAAWDQQQQGQKQQGQQGQGPTPPMAHQQQQSSVAAARLEEQQQQQQQQEQQQQLQRQQETQAQPRRAGRLRWLTRWFRRQQSHTLQEQRQEQAAVTSAVTPAALLQGGAQQQQQQQQQQGQQQGQEQQQWRPALRAVYQVLVDPSTGATLGATPCDAAAAAALGKLPLAGELRGPGFAAKQDRYLESFQPDRLQRRRKAPGPPPLPFAPAARRPLPDGGPAVLRLELVAQGGGIQVGKGKSRVLFALMEPRVTPWTEADSLEAWRGTGSIIGPEGPLPL